MLLWKDPRLPLDSRMSPLVMTIPSVVLSSVSLLLRTASRTEILVQAQLLSTILDAANGLNSALRGDGPPFNVLGGIPTIAADYTSPLWDVNVGTWTAEAVDNGYYRTRWFLEEFQILGFVERGLVTGPGGATFGSSGW